MSLWGLKQRYTDFWRGLTPAVAAAVPRAVAEVLAVLDSLNEPEEAGGQAMISPEILRRYPYFAGVDDESLRQLAMIAEEKSASPPAPNCSAMGTRPSAWVILSGEVNIQYLLGSGELRTVDTLVGGDLLGWSALVEPYKYTGLARPPGTDLGRIDAGKLRDLCNRDALLGYR